MLYYYRFHSLYQVMCNYMDIIEIIQSVEKSIQDFKGSTHWRNSQWRKKVLINLGRKINIVKVLKNSSIMNYLTFTIFSSKKRMFSSKRRKKKFFKLQNLQKVFFRSSFHFHTRFISLYYRIANSFKNSQLCSNYVTSILYSLI